MLYVQPGHPASRVSSHDEAEKALERDERRSSIVGIGKEREDDRENRS